jgi:hemerythrin-like domain-containing protein
MVGVLTALHKSISSGDDTDADVLTDVVDFFRMFADKNHHAKEEYALFPILERRGVDPPGCTIENLKSEHKQARMLMGNLADAISKHKTGDPVARSEISMIITNAVHLYQDHIWRENIVLFPMSEKVLRESDLDEVAKSYGEVEKGLGPDFRSKYEQLARALEKATNASQEG